MGTDAPEIGHVEKARQTIRALHTAHDETATAADRFVDLATATVGRPAAIIFVFLATLGWAGANLYAGARAIDRFPFPDLEAAISAIALAVALLILASQRRADRLADAREKMALELSLQNAQKVSKIIELLEELRRDSPNVPDRQDPEAVDMSKHQTDTEVLKSGEDGPPGADLTAP